VRILFLSPDFVLPAESGLRVRTLSQLHVLAGLPGVESITFLSLTGAAVSEARQRELERVVPKVRVEPPIVQPGSVRRSPRTLARVLRLRLLAAKPYIVAKSDNPAMRALLREHLRSGRYDVVYIGYLGMMGFAPDVRKFAPRAALVLEQHNVEWEIFDRLASNHRPPMRQAIQWEAQTMRRFEQAAMRQVDGVIAISRADADNLRALSGVESVVVPPFIEPGPPRTETTTAPALGYIGHLGWQPNALGLDWFCRDIWPLVRQRMPGATLTIAGPGLRKGPDGKLLVPPGWVQPGITTAGFVDDLQDIYKATLAMVAPVIGGSGVRMKLLETMRAGMPTVTTTDGAAGLGVAHGREVLVADAAAAFADGIVRVLTDADLRAGMRRAGYEFLARHHSREAAQERVDRMLAAACGARRVPQNGASAAFAAP
jgi:glycosyltransferase involved in cell wall biosynthesis